MRLPDGLAKFTRWPGNIYQMAWQYLPDGLAKLPHEHKTQECGQAAPSIDEPQKPQML
jgi:hypothetical protein